MRDARAEEAETVLRLLELNAGERDGRAAAERFEQALETVFGRWVRTGPERGWAPPGSGLCSGCPAPGLRRG